MSRDELLRALRQNGSESGDPPVEIGKGRMDGLNTFHAEKRKQIKDCPGLSSSNHDHNSCAVMGLIWGLCKGTL